MAQTAKSKKSGFRQSPWFKLVWIVPLVIVVLAAASIATRVYLGSNSGHSFLESYPGKSELPDGSPEGFAGFIQWQHALNIFFIVLLIRSGWLVHSQTKPEAFWTRNNKGRLKTKRPPTKMSLYLWLHLSVDFLWVLNGIIFIVLLFTSGSWIRVVPIHWDIIPNAWSAGLQYLSFNWPVETAWTNYNALQVLAYFVTIFIAAPLAAITGIRMSPVWSPTWKINKFYPAALARAIHLPVMFYYVVFIIVHVFLVFTTGMRHNLNYMFSNQPEGSLSWLGFALFVVTLIVVIAGWIGARPIFMRSVAELTGKVTRR